MHWIGATLKSKSTGILGRGMSPTLDVLGTSPCPDQMEIELTRSEAFANPGSGKSTETERLHARGLMKNAASCLSPPFPLCFDENPVYREASVCFGSRQQPVLPPPRGRVTALKRDKWAQGSSYTLRSPAESFYTIFF